MLSKEQLLEIISYCETHGARRKDRLRVLGISEWDFYKSRRCCLRQEKINPECAGSFIQLESGGGFVPATVTEMERRVNPGSIQVQSRFNPGLIQVVKALARERNWQSNAGQAAEAW